jgi:cytochrome c556
LSAEDRAYFLELANRLRSDARALQAQAARGDIGPADEALARITTTCDACHKAFRILPWPLIRAAP